MYAFKDYAAEVLEKVQKPMTVAEIWEQGVRLGLDEKLGSSGKTPWQSLGAQIYMDIKQNDAHSRFVQVSKRPALFALKGQAFAAAEILRRQAESETTGTEKSYAERDLHPVLVKYLRSDPYFRCCTKTVYHEKSAKGRLHQDKWTYPDLIGVHFPYDDYEKLTLETLELFHEPLYKIFSFEMKKKIDLGNLRSEYFQAVSNSSWANEGYLAAPQIATENEDFMNELMLLNGAFGIGVIRLNIERPEESEIVLHGRQRQDLDGNMLDKLILKNKDVRDFFGCVLKSKSLGEIVGGERVFDAVLQEEEYRAYLRDKNMSEEA